MPEIPLKQQIMNRLLENLRRELVNVTARGDVRVQKVEWFRDPTQLSASHPSINLFDGADVEIGSENTSLGRTREFAVSLRLILLADARGAAEAVTLYCAEIVRVLESDIQLNRLCNQVFGIRMEPFFDKLTSPVCGAFIEFTIQYRHHFGDPYANGH